MPFSVMAGLVPAILVVRLARGPNALPTGAPTVSETAAPLDDVDGRDIGRSEERPSFDGLCPAMTVGAADVTPFHPRGPAGGRAELAMTTSSILRSLTSPRVRREGEAVSPSTRSCGAAAVRACHSGRSN